MGLPLVGLVHALRQVLNRCPRFSPVRVQSVHLVVRPEVVVVAVRVAARYREVRQRRTRREQTRVAHLKDGFQLGI